MLDTLLDLDKSLFITINSLHNEFWDSFMLGVSHNYFIMGVILLTLLLLCLKTYGKKCLFIFFAVLLSFGLSDIITSKVFKPGFKRLRPCYEQSIKENVHLAKRYCAGKYGFVSSHASNSFAVITIFYLFLRSVSPTFFYLFIYSGLVGYSRIYLGKHYPLDVLCGALFGIIIALTIYKITKKSRLRNKSA